MSVRINTNIEAMNAQRNLGITALQFSKSVEKLSSGLRINRAADDAAGLAISQKLAAQVTGLNQAQRNAQDAISMVQTAEGALNEVQSMLQRMRELAVQAANSTLSTSDVQSVNTEITALKAEIDRIATATTFNGQQLLTGSLSVAQSGGTAAAGAVVVGGTNTSITAVDVSGAKASSNYTLTSGAGNTLILSDGTISQTVTLGAIAANGSTKITFGNMGVSISVASVTGETAANVAGGMNAMTITTGAGTNATFQIGANSGDSLGVSFANAQTSAAGYGTLVVDITAFSTATGSGVGVIAAAQALITSSDAALGYVSTTRGNFGAIQNRLEHTIASLGVSSENLSASASRIKDLDVAAEMVTFTKTQILQQAGTAILAQANQAPQNILSLLK
ncbi:MAG: flagellin [Chloroflexota bacterium]